MFLKRPVSCTNTAYCIAHLFIRARVKRALNQKRSSSFFFRWGTVTGRLTSLTDTNLTNMTHKEHETG